MASYALISPLDLYLLRSGCWASMSWKTSSIACHLDTAVLLTCTVVPSAFMTCTANCFLGSFISLYLFIIEGVDYPPTWRGYSTNILINHIPITSDTINRSSKGWQCWSEGRRSRPERRHQERGRVFFLKECFFSWYLSFENSPRQTRGVGEIWKLAGVVVIGGPTIPLYTKFILPEMPSRCLQ